MSNDLPVIQIVAIHLQPIGDSVLVPIKRTQVQISGWTVLRRHPRGRSASAHLEKTANRYHDFFYFTLLVTALAIHGGKKERDRPVRDAA